MARSVSVPLLLLLLTLASAAAGVYQQMAGVSNARAKWVGEWEPSFPAPASECVSSCDADPRCSGYVHKTDNNQCTLYIGDCRGQEPYGPLAPTDYMAKNACPGTDADRCACPEGWHRYGSRCLQLLNQPVDNNNWQNANYQCRPPSAYLIVPRTQEERDQLKLAATELQTEPLTNIWLGVYQGTDGNWYNQDNCGRLTASQVVLANEAPTSSYQNVFYSPPGVADSTEGWYATTGNDVERYLPLCQLQYCYRPDCVV